jgi:UDP-2-acetamido-3-amino-2,3-dideoxy-glucuronate N-acetyltransferase
MIKGLGYAAQAIGRSAVRLVNLLTLSEIEKSPRRFSLIHLEDDVFCGPSVVLRNVYNPLSEIKRKHEFRKTDVKQGATLGANCTIVRGITIGDYAFVGAGAIVNRDVAPYALMLGGPAKQHGWMCRCGIRLHGAGKVDCECGAAYRVDKKSCKPI